MEAYRYLVSGRKTALELTQLPAFFFCLFVGVCFLTWSIPKMKRVPYTIAIPIAERFKLSQGSGTSCCLIHVPAASRSWDFPWS